LANTGRSGSKGNGGVRDKPGVEPRESLRSAKDDVLGDNELVGIVEKGNGATISCTEPDVVHPKSTGSCESGSMLRGDNFSLVLAFATCFSAELISSAEGCNFESTESFGGRQTRFGTASSFASFIKLSAARLFRSTNMQTDDAPGHSLSKLNEVFLKFSFVVTFKLITKNASFQLADSLLCWCLMNFQLC
jgi:hypothetical protein